MVIPVDPRAIASLLAEVEPFGELDDDTRLAMARRAGRQVVDQGQIVFWQDDPGDSMFVLLEGVVKLVLESKSGEMMELVRHHSPAPLGELALLDGGPREVTAEAVERSTLLVVTRSELLPLVRSDFHVAEALLRTLCGMVRRNTRQISKLVFLNLQGRVAAMLLDLTEPGQAKTRRITQGELATMVGGARMWVNQALRSLEGRGYIRVAGRAVEIVEPQQLRRLAGG
jgi:CRP/FNR family cyclic AMP-dependent transcriptional regulator